VVLAHGRQQGHRLDGQRAALYGDVGQLKIIDRFEDVANRINGVLVEHL